MRRPILFLIIHERVLLETLTSDLRRRFGRDCRILSERTPAAALNALAQLAAQEEPVALLIADQWISEMAGVDFLAWAHGMHPAAKRVLLVERDYSVSNPIVPAMMLGKIDYHLVKPWVPEQGLYPAISQFLADWAAAQEPSFKMFCVVGPTQSARPRNPGPAHAHEHALRVLCRGL